MARPLAGAPCCCCWWSIRRFRPSWPSASRLRLHRRRGCRMAGPRAAVRSVPPCTLHLYHPSVHFPIHSSNSVRFAKHPITCFSCSCSYSDPSSSFDSFPSISNRVDEDAFEVELGRLLALLPEELSRRVSEHSELNQLVEMVMDLGRRPLARFPSGDLVLSDRPIGFDELNYAVAQVGDFAIDNRAGISRTLHRISAIRNRKGVIIGLTCRVGRAIAGSANLLKDLIKDGSSLLLIGPPGVGKTTIIREIARMLADEYKKRVMIVDTSNEIGGDGDIPHPGIGNARRMQVPNTDIQHKVLIEAVENHMPQAIVIDEIGTKLEAMAASTIAQRGIQLVATAHGVTIENLIMNPSLEMLVGGVQSVTLGDEEASKRGGQKTVLERKGPSTFTCGVEIISKTELRVHCSLEATVDALLSVTCKAHNAREDFKRVPFSCSELTWMWMYLESKWGELKWTTRLNNGKPDPPSSRAPKTEVRRSIPQGSKHEVLTAEKEPFVDIFSESQEDLITENVPEISEDGFTKRYVYSTRCVQIIGHGYLDSVKFIVVGSTTRHKDQRAFVLVLLSAQLFGPSAPLDATTLVDAVLVLNNAPYGAILEASIIQVLRQLKADDAVELTDNISEAHALLALRSRLKKNSGIQAVVKSHYLPVYVTKTSSLVQITKAIRSILSEHADGVKDSLAEDKTRSSEKIDALERKRHTDFHIKGSDVNIYWQEARLAIERVVIPKGEPVDMLPRPDHIISIQIELVQKYHLRHEKIGKDPDFHLRILPFPSRMDDSGLHEINDKDKEFEESSMSGDENASVFSVDRLPLLPD
ncbi:hypothetical protein Scep_028074 [Stephania cephalantha]|uniref:AAA+ ATPase domain-containing protein n=1 Tax=Stephania cephalantha TaxID=152367 RepID=A0AAP0HLF5_9MAGN